MLILSFDDYNVEEGAEPSVGGNDACMELKDQ